MKRKIIRHFKIIFPLVCLLAITGLGLFLYYTYDEALSLTKEQFNNQQILVAKQTAVGIEENNKLLVYELEDLSLEPAIKNLNLKESRRIIKKKFDHIQGLHINDVGLLDSKGITIISLKAPQFEGAYFPYREHFRKAKTLKTSTAVFDSITYKEDDKSQEGIIIAMPVFSPEGEFVGVIFFTITINDLIQAFVSLESKDSEVYVIDASGKILYYPGNLQYKITDNMQNADASFETFIEKVKAGRIFTGEYLTPEGIKTIAAVYPLRFADHTWSIIIATPEEVVSKLLRPLSLKYAIATLMALLAVTGISLIIFYFINRQRLKLDAMVNVQTKNLSLMVETINELIWEVDPHWKYVYMSPMVRNILGYEPEELIGETIFKLMPADDAQKLKAALQKSAESKRPFSNIERSTTSKNGKLKMLETNVTPIFNDKGNLLGFRGSDRDITLRNQAEIKLQKYALELEEARNNLKHKVEERTEELKNIHEVLLRKEKLAALGELAGSVSHELRNPLGVIKNATYFLNMRMNTFKDEAIKENLKILTREINTANKIISDLLDFTREKTPVHLDVNLNKLVEEMLSKSSIPDNIKVIVELTDQIIPISIDPTQIAQVFLNLIENGLHSMEEGGTLKISTRVTDNTMDVIFADEGYGIPEDNLDKIFNPLFTTKAKGIGLGLAISKSLAEANGGSILVESDEKKGSTFTVSFAKKD